MGVSTDFSDPRLTAMGLFAEAYTGLTHRCAAEFERHRLSPVEFDVLIRLARSPRTRLRMTDLSAQTSLSTSGVTRVVDRMDRDGLIQRQACPRDRRSSYAVITPAGLARLDATIPGLLKIVQQWFIDQLDPTELESMLGSLRRIRDAVNPCATSGATGMSEEPAPEAP